MRNIIAQGAYSFDASAKTIFFGDVNAFPFDGTIFLNKFLIITNVTDNVIIYDAFNPAKGGTLATDTLTLDCDTSSMDDTDILQIIYEANDPHISIGGVTPVEILDNVGNNPFDNNGQVGVNNFPTDYALEAGGNLETIKDNTTTLLNGQQVEGDAYTAAQKLMMAGGVRRDANTSPVDTDGDVHPFVFNDEGRLKVSATPASVTAQTGSITANGQTVVATVSRFSNLMCHCTGTFSTVNVTFEGSINGGTNWFTVQVIRSNANTIETTSGNLSAAPAYAWEASVNGLTHFRVRATAFTSGTQNWTFLPGVYATEPIPGSQVSGTQPISGTVTITNPNGTSYNVVTTASTNAANIKNAAGNLFQISISNPTATAAYVKLYNKASSPTVGTDVPVITIAIPATAAGVGEKVYTFGQVGMRFATGISIAVTAAAAATDTGNAVAGVQINATYI